MVDFADDTSTELERKARTLGWVCLVETVSYLILFGFWVSGNDLGTKMFGSVHGMVFLGFAAMVVGIHRAMGWTPGYVVLVLVTGPVGALLVFERLRRHGVPGAAAMGLGRGRVPSR